MAIEQDYDYCRKVIKRHSKSFYYGFSQLPKDEANAVYAIYTFCRMADDIVDESIEGTDRTAALQNFLQQVDNFDNGIRIDHAMWRALEDVRSKFPLDIGMFRKQIIGQMMDLDFTQPATIGDLYHYSSHVAGSVGELLYPILADEDTQEGRKLADELGIAMQMTNILRDIGEDYKEHGRIYIPGNIMKQYGYTEEQLKKGQIESAFIEMWEHLAQDAESKFNHFYPYISQYKLKCRQPLYVAVRIYAEILNEVRRNNYDCLTKRNKVSLFRKNQLSQQTFKGEK